MSIQHERRTAEDRRQHHMNMPPEFERRLNADRRKLLMVEYKMHDADAGISGANWEAYVNVPTRDSSAKGC